MTKAKSTSPAGSHKAAPSRSTGATKSKATTTSSPASKSREGDDHSISPDDRMPIKMLNDRLLVDIDGDEGDRRSTGGILIPATAQLGKRLTWAKVKAVGPNVRSVELGDQVLFNPQDRYEVEVQGRDYIILRERDVHAVASERLEEGSTGLYI